MKQEIISEQKNTRLSIVTNEIGVHYLVQSKNHEGKWRNVKIFSVSNSGMEKAIQCYYRLIICEIDADTLMAIDNDFVNFSINNLAYV